MSKPTQAQREAAKRAVDRIVAEILSGLLLRREIVQDMVDIVEQEIESLTPESMMVVRPDGSAERVETEREVDGRWLAEVMAIPGALAYGKTRRQAISAAMKIAAEVRAAAQGHKNWFKTS